MENSATVPDTGYGPGINIDPELLRICEEVGRVPAPRVAAGTIEDVVKK